MQVTFSKTQQPRHIPYQTRFLAALLFGTGLLVFAPHAQALDRYTASYDVQTETMSVEACFGTPLPARLVHHEAAGRFSEGIRLGNNRLRLRLESTSTPLPAKLKKPCLGWQVALGRAVDSAGERDHLRVGADLVMDTSLWFWSPPGSRESKVTLALPPGVNASVPWNEVAHGQGAVEYSLQSTPASWTSRFAIGRFEVHPVSVQGTDLRLAILGDLNQAQKEKLSQWISHTARAVGHVYGQFPRGGAQLLIVPIGTRREPVPWAHVIRGGGPAVEFFVDENQPLAAFTGDWTAYHELSHLLLPFVSSNDRWLSEGLASYYQYVLMSRSGMLGEQEAWQGLYNGFKRGEAGNRTLTLARATREGWRETMRVYWSGAALMFLADVQLRTLSNGTQTLDTVLAGLRACCINGGRRWQARDLFREMDRISGTQVFLDLYKTHVNSTEFPDTAETWRVLGVDTSHGRLSFMPEVSPALRTSIMHGK